MEDGGDSDWIGQTDDVHQKKGRKKKGGCLSGSFRWESSRPGRAFLILACNFP
jgi:hypothetical protein